MSSRTHSTTRQYSLGRVKRSRSNLKGKPSYKLRLHDGVTNRGCVLSKVVAALQQQYPYLRVQRVGEDLQIARKKRALFNILDPVVAKAIDQAGAIHSKTRDKANQDYRPERRLKARVNTTNATVTKEEVVGVRDRSLAARIANGSLGTWLDANQLAIELADGRQLTAV